MNHICYKQIIYTLYHDFYNKQMILQLEHHHQEPTLQKPVANELSKSVPGPLKPTPKGEELVEAPSILLQLLSSSSSLVNGPSKQQIRQLIKYNEEKVHLSFSNEPNDYLAHIIRKNKSQNNQLLKEIIGLQNDLFAIKVQKGHHPIKSKPQISTFKSSITNKITDMKKSIMSLSSLDRKLTKQFENVMEFRKKSYWKVPSAKSEELKEFLSKMRRIQSEHKKKYDKSLLHQQNQMKRELQQEQHEKEQLRKHLYYKQLEKQAKWRKQRQLHHEQDKRKKEDIESLLKKINFAKPIYQRNEEQFLKNVVGPLEQERQKKLEEIKESRLPLNQEQFDEHLLKYNEYKESLLEEHKKKNEEQREMDSKLEQELSQLYHSKFHKEISPRFYSSALVEREKMRKKVKIFEEVSLEKHKPRVDLRKRQKLQESILQLQLAQNKKKRKVVHADGSVSLQDKPLYDPKKIGVQYLAQLKEQHQANPITKPSKSHSVEPDPPRIKRIDYLRQNKPSVKLKQTIGDWKKVVQDMSYSPREKFECIMQRAVLFQQKAKVKQQELRSYKRGEKANLLKEQMDKLYLQSVAAKMVVLKDVILKQ